MKSYLMNQNCCFLFPEAIGKLDCFIRNHRNLMKIYYLNHHDFILRTCLAIGFFFSICDSLFLVDGPPTKYHQLFTWPFNRAKQSIFYCYFYCHFNLFDYLLTSFRSSRSLFWRVILPNLKCFIIC